MNRITHKSINPLLAILLLLLINSCSEEELPNDTDALESYRKEVYNRINAFRATENLPALARWPDGDICADEQAKKDALSNTPHGSFGDCNENGQNICPGWSSFDNISSGCMQQMWDEGPGEDFQLHGHYLNMSNTDFTKVAIGFYVEEDGSIWAVQNFK